MTLAALFAAPLLLALRPTPAAFGARASAASTHSSSSGGDIHNGLIISRRSIVHSAAGLGILAAAPALPAHAELYTTAADCTGIGMCSGNAKVQLASYDVMLLKRSTDELNEMSEGASEGKKAGYEECKRLINLVLDLDWASLDAAAKKLDASLDSTKRLSKGIKAKDPKTVAKAVLEIAEDLDVSTFTSAGTGQPAMVGARAGNPYDPRNQ